MPAIRWTMGSCPRSRAEGAVASFLAIAGRRPVPLPVVAASICLLFAAIGLAVLDHYGVGVDEFFQRRIGILNLDYLLGNADLGHFISVGHNRFYGISFELPLLLVERALGLGDLRDVLLMRHLLTHLFFLLGAFFCGLLAHRMFGNRALAALAMLLFLLHPRLYAHSFFNSKDVPFAAMFMIALFLTHRAFRSGTLGSFALCGVGVGLAANLRVFGLLLLLLVPALRALDLWLACGAAERRRILATTGLFTVSALTTLYVLHPYYWTNPLRFFDGLQDLSQHAWRIDNLFQGELLHSHEVPPHYIPTWFAVTAPPVTLLLAGIGAASACAAGLVRPRRMLRNGELRFRLLLLGCSTLPVAAAVALQSTIYNGWRHLYFLWVPASLLAASGLHWLVGSCGRRVGSRARRVLAYGATGAGLVCVLAEMASLHPHQQIYFNWLVDRSTPGALAQRFDMDYWRVSNRQVLEHLLERHPGEVLHVHDRAPTLVENLQMLEEPDRRRILSSPPQTAAFHIGGNPELRMRLMPSEPLIYELRAYGSPYFQVVAPKLVWGSLRPDGDSYRAAYLSVTNGGGLAARSRFDVHLLNDALYYLREGCGPEDTGTRFFLHLFPRNFDDLPALRRRHGFDNRDFDFDWRGGHFDEVCITQEPLPDYPIARIRTGQHVGGGGPVVWKADFPVSEDGRPIQGV